jgi:hypothetical protein
MDGDSNADNGTSNDDDGNAEGNTKGDHGTNGDSAGRILQISVLIEGSLNVLKAATTFLFKKRKKGEFENSQNYTIQFLCLSSPRIK